MGSLAINRREGLRSRTQRDQRCLHLAAGERHRPAVVSPFMRKLTVPVAPGVTVAVNATIWPATAGLGEATMVTVLGDRAAQAVRFTRAKAVDASRK